jgi:hypothetical protein
MSILMVRPGAGNLFSIFQHRGFRAVTVGMGTFDWMRFDAPSLSMSTRQYAILTVKKVRNEGNRYEKGALFWVVE